MKSADLKYHLRLWSRANRRNRAQNIYFHFDKHGGNLSLEAYLTAAECFPRLHARRLVDRGDGTTTLNDRHGHFLIVETATGLIVSYGANP